MSLSIYLEYIFAVVKMILTRSIIRIKILYQPLGLRCHLKSWRSSFSDSSWTRGDVRRFHRQGRLRTVGLWRDWQAGDGAPPCTGPSDARTTPICRGPCGYPWQWAWGDTRMTLTSHGCGSSSCCCSLPDLWKWWNWIGGSVGLPCGKIRMIKVKRFENSKNGTIESVKLIFIQ